MADVKKVLQIDMRELSWALGDSSLTRDRHIDLENGDIVERFEFEDISSSAGVKGRG